MTSNDSGQGQLKAADSLRATLLSLIAKSLGDDFLELVEGTAPSEQRLDSAVWLTATEEGRGDQREVDELLSEMQARFAALGLRGMVFVASDRWLVEERHRIRARLYGSSMIPQA
jgi:hypothetical protein